MARPASDIQARIVSAATARFLAEGVDGASLRAIARDADTSVGMIHYYFPSKDELFLACVEDVYGQLVADVEAVVNQAQDVSVRIERLYARLSALSEEEVRVVRLVVREGLVSSARMARLFERFSRGHVGLLLSLMQQGRARGELRRDLPPLVLVIATAALGVLPQVFRARLAEAGLPVAKLLPAPAVLARLMSEVLLHGIGGRQVR